MSVPPEVPEWLEPEWLVPHAEDGATRRVTPHGAVEWIDAAGRRHRDGDRPALIHSSGSVEWWRHGQTHRATGPAVILARGEGTYWLLHEVPLDRDARADLERANDPGLTAAEADAMLAGRPAPPGVTPDQWRAALAEAVAYNPGAAHVVVGGTRAAQPAAAPPAVAERAARPRGVDPLVLVMAVLVVLGTVAIGVMVYVVTHGVRP